MLALVDSPTYPKTVAPRRRVLLVEDDPESALFCTHVLEKRGRFEVTHTADPVAALALIVAASWDLVIAGLDLPVMSGLEFVAALGLIAPGLPVVLVTASPDDAWSASGERGRQPDALLAKPVPGDLLLTTAAALASPGGQTSRMGG
jgi:CheY-like chemotaxis protein